MLDEHVLLKYHSPILMMMMGAKYGALAIIESDSFIETGSASILQRGLTLYEALALSKILNLGE